MGSADLPRSMRVWQVLGYGPAFVGSGPTSDRSPSSLTTRSSSQ